MNTTTLGNTFAVGRAYENETLKVAATAELDRILSLFNEASWHHAAIAGKVGADAAFENAMRLHELYTATKSAYRALGLHGLGIHN